MNADRDKSEQPVIIAPIPRPCRGCGVGEAQQHIDDCPAVVEALEAAQRPSPGLTAPDATTDTPDTLGGAQRAHSDDCERCYWKGRAWAAEAKAARVENTLHAWQVGPWSPTTRDLLRDLRAALAGPEATEVGK